MTSLRRSLVSGCLLLAGTALPASAQQQGPNPAFQPQMPVLQYSSPGTPYGFVPGQIGDVCFTGKGSCNLLKPLQVGSRCDCAIPGYGRRKGIVQP